MTYEVTDKIEQVETKETTHKYDVFSKNTGISLNNIQMVRSNGVSYPDPSLYTVQQSISLWFIKANPVATDNFRKVQVGVSVEEFSEMLETLASTVENSKLNNVVEQLKTIAGIFKDGTLNDVAQYYDMDKLMDKSNAKLRKKFLDDCMDTCVTLNGNAVAFDMNPSLALEKVDYCNWSKYKNGQVVYLDNGKIGKADTTIRPEDSLLDDCV